MLICGSVLFFSTERDRLIEVKSSNTFEAHFGVKPLWRWPCFWNWSTQRSNERKMLLIMVAPGSGCNRCLFIYLFIFPFLDLFCCRQIGLLGTLMTSAQQLWPAPSLIASGILDWHEGALSRFGRGRKKRQNAHKKTSFPVQDLSVQILVFTYINNFTRRLSSKR